MRRHALDDVFHQGGFDVVGLQEVKGGEFAPASSVHYLIWSAPAVKSPAGGWIGGCELWINKKLGVLAGSPAVLAIAHDLLMVRACILDLRVVFMVAHAPHAMAEPGVIET